MCVYLRTKFQVSTVILTSFRHGIVLPPPTSKENSKEATQVRVKYLSIWKVNFELSGTFFSFFHLVCKFFKGIFKPLCQSVNCMSWVFELGNISEMSKRLSTIYIWNLVVLIFMESFICGVCTISNFFWSVNCTNLV